ncbi:MAG: hypothetical protein Q8R02_23290 [Hyphomonadaceae bacterium]|nr:hypothetical protein [Hyphomonadaceae bacterium]
MNAPKTLAQARIFLDDYEHGRELDAKGHGWVIRLSAALVASEERNSDLLAVLHEIKRCNAQYNFGSKLLRIVLPAIAKAEAP